MIFDQFILLISIALDALILPFRILPEVDLGGDYSSYFIRVADVIASYDWIIDADIVVAVIVLLTTFAGGYIVYQGVNWIIRKIPTIS